MLVLFLTSTYLKGQEKKSFTVGNTNYKIPLAYLEPPKEIPDFWVSEIDEVTAFLYNTVKKGKIEIIGKSVSGRPIRAVTYGTPRGEKGTTTFSAAVGGIGLGDLSYYRGKDHDKTVYMSMASVHGGEFEGIVGMVNLISVIETGKDLRGREWPEVNEVVKKLDRIILIPITNPDARARIPARMLKYWGTDNRALEYINTGGNADGSITGWPEVKEHIPVDLSKPGFPGGYPNDNGVNLQHDDFFKNPQPETKMLYELTDRERPDLILNLHTGAIYPNLLPVFCIPAVFPAYEGLYKKVHRRFIIENLAEEKDPGREIKVPANRSDEFNLDAALNMHCGALSVVFESPSHAFSNKMKSVVLNPNQLLDGQLLLHIESMKFLSETGGFSKWVPARVKKK